MTANKGSTPNAYVEVRKLLTAAEALATFWTRFRKRTAKPEVDKAGAWFDLGDPDYTDYRVLEIPVNKTGISFCAYTGVYEASTCAPFAIGGGVDGELLRPYFNTALNEHAKAVFATMAKLMRADAAKHIGAARSELESMLTMLDSLEAERGKDAAEASA